MVDSSENEISSTSTGGAPKMPNLSGPTVPVMVGETVYHLHEALVANASKFFENALKSEWRTDYREPIDLSEESEQVFEGFLQWLYTSKVPDQYQVNKLLINLADLYVLGERLQAAMFQSAVLAAVIAGVEKHDRWLGMCSIRVIYDGTASKSPARHLMADMCAFSIHYKAKRLEKLDAEKDGEFMKDLIISMAKYRAKPNVHEDRPWIVNPDAYLLDRKDE